MFPTGLAFPALLLLSAIAAAVLIHAVYDLYAGSRHDADRGD